MRKPVWMLFCAAALSLFGATSNAAADYDRDIDDTRIYGGVWLGLAGDASFDDGEPITRDVDYSSTLGGQLGIDVVTAKYFSLGGEARIGASKLLAGGDRSKMIDLDFKPRLRLPLYRLPIELYATVPVGITIPRLVDFDEDANGKVGWNIGVGAGLNWFITRGFGVNVEPIWLRHHFKVDGPYNDITVQQFALLINAVIAL